MAEPKHKRAPHTDFQVLLFIVCLCFTCGLLLAVIAYSLRIPQKEAKDFDQSKQMLISAKILNHLDYFEIKEADDTYIPAQFDADKKILIPSKEEIVKATDDQIKEISDLRIRPLLTDQKGNISTFKEKGLSISEYLEKNTTSGYANLPEKLFYAILPNEPDVEKITAEDLVKDLTQAAVYVFPVSGFGLWGPIYGYLAVESNGDTVVGTTWYDHGETPGLGANIAEAGWQNQFYGKLVFQEPASGTTDFQTADMGIIVVKGKVSDVYGSKPKSKSAVDGISGATLTGEGVTNAYKNSLTPYRELLINIHKKAKNDD